MTHSLRDAGDHSLRALGARVEQDLAYLNYPPLNWLAPTTHSSGRPVSDVVVVGGGMCGLVAAFALTRAGIRNLRILDKNPEGFEGPWMTYARMETLRSPKQLLGPAYGMASLTFRAWFTAQFGTEAWEELFRIPRPMWMDYLRWYRSVLKLPVENGIEVTRVRPLDDLLELEIENGNQPAILTRRVVLANGREGLGAPTIPSFVRDLPRERWSHSSDEIDFAALRGKRVVVIGVGASAMDNAAVALEEGACEVRLLARRRKMPMINKLMGVGSYGMTAGFPKLSPAWRWRIMDYSFKQQTPAPRNSTQRVSRHPDAFFHFGYGIESMHVQDDEIVIRTQAGRNFVTDHVILGTGFSVNATSRPELAEYSDRIATWGDHYTPPAEAGNADLATFPWLGEDFSFMEKEPGTAPWLSKIHCFNYGATLSLGKVSGDIPAISEGAAWLARGVAASFFVSDVEHHWQALLDYAQPELQGDEWQDADAEKPAGVRIV
ncbi:NAD(P)-binding domain-containing protein [Microvirga sp. TS319]|uniref:NAD(P)-binding domain-containing protein n=1 Tax=Microvirga sp. TS319 TaxID=3241165 RepID=UPI00351A511C